MTFCALFLCKTLYSRLIHCEMLQAAFSQFLCVFNFIWRRRNNSHSVFNDRKNEFSQKNAQIHLRFSPLLYNLRINNDKPWQTQTHTDTTINRFIPSDEWAFFILWEKITKNEITLSLSFQFIFGVQWTTQQLTNANCYSTIFTVKFYRWIRWFTGLMIEWLWKRWRLFKYPEGKSRRVESLVDPQGPRF